MPDVFTVTSPTPNPDIRPARHAASGGVRHRWKPKPSVMPLAYAHAVRAHSTGKACCARDASRSKPSAFASAEQPKREDETMDHTERLEYLIAYYMGKEIDLSPEALDAERSELTRSVLMAVGKNAIQGDAAAADMLFKMKVLRLP